MQNLTTEIICCKCLAMSLRCYKFVKTCKNNTEYFRKAISTIDKFCYDTTKIITKNNNYKTAYLKLDEQCLNGIQYYDQRIVTGDFNKALKRLEAFSDLGKNVEQFYDSSDILNHLETQPNETKRKRRKRKEDFDDKITITEMLFDQNNLSLYKCKECQRLFPRMHNLKRHFIRVHAPKDYSCSKCGKGFGSPAILAEHKMESHSGKKAICIECGKKYANARSLKLHETSHKLMLTCKSCGKIFNRKRNYQVHVISKRCEQSSRRKDVEKKYICDYCNKKYGCKGTLRVHIQFEHENTYHHICSWCGKKFSSLSKLKAHSVKHTQEKNFSCEICGGCYVTKESLLYHTRTHTGEKPYQCEHCNQRFLSASRRSEHIRRHHMEPTLECDVCHTKFKGRSCLLRHKKRHFDPNSRLHYTKLAENEV